MRAVINRLIKAFLHALPLAWLNRLLISSIEVIERRQAEFVTLHRRPKAADGVNLSTLPRIDDIDESEIAIVIQGPLRREEQFTLETVRLY
jgi:hypothetical protein